MVSAPRTIRGQRPALLDQAQQLDARLKQYAAAELKLRMHLSEALAGATHALISAWNSEAKQQSLALDAFRGDIYRGLLAETMAEADRAYANEHLRILSGLYGILKPFDRIMPYRLELMYPVSGEGFSSLYQFWGDTIAAQLPKRGPIINLASQEYFRVIGPFVAEKRVVEPQFLSHMRPGDDARFVAVHAKIARGAFARWLIESRITDPAHLLEFNALDYQYDPASSTPAQPTFIKAAPA